MSDGEVLCEVCSERPVHARGHCSRCYQFARRTGLLQRSQDYKGLPTTCIAEGCKLPAVARGKCMSHYRRKPVVGGSE